MEIICDGCNAKLNVPDEKIPQGQQVAITCPKCKKKLALDNRGEKPGPGFGDEAALEFYEDGLKLALVAEGDPGQAEKLRESIKDLGYRYVPVESTSQAISKMRFHTFDMVVLSDRFDGIDLAQSPVLQYLNHLSMSIRRRMFVVLVGDSFHSMDNMTAFTLSANLVVSTRDLDKLTGILKNAMADNDKFYKVFMDTLVEVGKS